MRIRNTNSDTLIRKLINLPKQFKVSILDSCGIRNLGSHLLICGINPIEIRELKEECPQKALKQLDEIVSNRRIASIFTLSYEFGLKINGIPSRFPETNEPDIFIAAFENLIVHNYETLETEIRGNPRNFDSIKLLLKEQTSEIEMQEFHSVVESTDSRELYVDKIDQIHEAIRRGETYQVNLTQQISAVLPSTVTPAEIYLKLRNNNPSPFSAFVSRENDHVVSTSPERFFRFGDGTISVSPIKGTRPRGKDVESDNSLKNELLLSEKDKAENVMIVDLMRNDLGRICEFGSIQVEKLFELETHPSLFHLVSTVSGKVKPDIPFSQVLLALFPCGSITGCPKIRTMRIIDQIENEPRGLSMGAIGYSDFEGNIDLNVAIRTMVIRGNEAKFNVGGGIVIDSDPNQEYDETLTKASALLAAINGKLEQE